MYKLTPVKVYMLERVQDDPACLTRMDRILGAIEMSRDDVVCITEENLPAEMAFDHADILRDYFSAAHGTRRS